MTSCLSNEAVLGGNQGGGLLNSGRYNGKRFDLLKWPRLVGEARPRAQLKRGELSSGATEMKFHHSMSLKSIFRHKETKQ